MRLLTASLGGLLVLIPVGIGTFPFLAPLWRRRDDRSGDGGDEAGQFVRVTSLSALPKNGTPRVFRVVRDRRDAWTYFEDEPVGSVYVRRTGDSAQAFNARCPHAACPVDYVEEREAYLCPCHNSLFGVTGERSPDSPSARDLDELDVEVRDGEVWVNYRNFRTGTAERIPLA